MDIHSKSEYPLNALSNFAAHSFVIDGVSCASMEGFLQSLKFKDIEVQKTCCALSGKEAKEFGLEMDWRDEQALYWQGRGYARDGAEYQSLISKAYDALAQNASFQKALIATGNKKLCHSIGVTDKKETILTEDEFISQLSRVRSAIQRHKNKSFAPK
tara:strand:+ start:376 stop:849 length:474 start_codon:yes stop_codon:yes gene_type:complete